MKKYIYFYYKTPITAKQFNNNVPEGWENEVDEHGEYSYGGYLAVENDNEE